MEMVKLRPKVRFCNAVNSQVVILVMHLSRYTVVVGEHRYIVCSVNNNDVSTVFVFM